MVLRMHSTADEFEGDRRTRLKLENAINLFGPGYLVGFNAPRKATRPTQALSFGEKHVSSLDLCLGTFSIIDVGGGHIPSLDLSLIVEKRIVAGEEPAVLSVFSQHTILTFKGHSA